MKIKDYLLNLQESEPVKSNDALLNLYKEYEKTCKANKEVYNKPKSTLNKFI